MRAAEIRKLFKRRDDPGPTVRDVYGIVNRNEMSYWTRIGTARVDRNGTISIEFDYLPTRGDIKVQIQAPPPEAE